MATMHTKTPPSSERPPIVVVMGHIDHGKSTLLDHIRKTNVVGGEAGGITQHTYAYEITHKNAEKEKRITFLDTPGHESFTLMRQRGAELADVAILVVAANDGVKTQTLEALEIIRKSAVPFVVAINKIDAPNANTEKVKQELAEHGTYLEGYGGDIPYVALSAKTGEHISELLDLILLVAEMEELKTSPEAPAEGFVVEAHRDPRAGITATLVIKNGFLAKKMYVVSGNFYAPVRRIEGTDNKEVSRAYASSPVRIAGWDGIPHAGAAFISLPNKKEAENAIRENQTKKEAAQPRGRDRAQFNEPDSQRVTVLLVLKADTRGTLDAVLHETKKIIHDVREAHKGLLNIHILHEGVGAISESDIKMVSGSKYAIVAGFNVPISQVAKDAAERSGISIATFSVIYELAEWLSGEIERKRPHMHTEEITGAGKIIRVFSNIKNKQVVGGKVVMGKLISGGKIRILRRDFPIGEGKILELQQQKTKTSEIAEGSEFGAMVESRQEIAEGDTVEEYITVEK